MSGWQIVRGDPYLSHVPNISSTGYNSWHTCNRHYYFQDILGIVLVREEGARRLGGLFHSGLESWWKARAEYGRPWHSDGDELRAALDGIDANARHVDTDPVDVERAKAMLIVYHARYSGDGPESVQFSSVYRDKDGDVERWFNLPLLDRNGREVGGWRLVGKKDAVKRFADGRIRVVEHKSTSNKVNAGSDYWIRLAVDTQVSMYVDAAQREGLDCWEAFYDVVRKLGHDRYLATPEAERKLTKGKGCRYCGGRAGGAQGVARGTGRVPVKVPETARDGTPTGRLVPGEVACTACEGTGWSEAPRLDARQRTEDEPLEDYRARLVSIMEKDPDSFFRQARVERSRAQLLDMRDDLVTTTGLISSMVELARRETGGNLSHPDARACFPRNSQTCTDVYGRSCDYLPVCSGRLENPLDSPLYAIRRRRNAPQQRLDLAGPPA
jgi:hypothetical protein